MTKKLLPGPDSPRTPGAKGGLAKKLLLLAVVLAGAWFGQDQIGQINQALTLTGEPVTQPRNEKSDCCLDLTTPERRIHILTGDRSGGGHKCGVGRPGKSEFPCDWSDDEVIHAISRIARDHGASCQPQSNGYCVIDRQHNAELIRVVLGRDRRFIVTGYPLNRPRNPR